MAVPIEFLRGVLGLLGIACAYLAGRAAVSVRKGWQKPSRLYGWTIRTLVCLAGVAFRHPLDSIDVVVCALAVLSFSAALWDTSRAKAPEPPPSITFPDEP